MPLSEYEQRVLEQMERQLASDDPRLVSTMQSGGGRSAATHWLVAGIGVVAGLLALVAGAAMSQVWLGVVGFLVMFAGVAYGFSPPRKKGPQGVVARDGSVAPRTRPASRRQPFMSRLEDRWDRRRDERGR